MVNKLTDIQNYARLIKLVFGDQASINTLINDTNTVIRALNVKSSKFKRNFLARLRRLYNIYKDDPQNLEELIVQVKEIASTKNWHGAFAELVAYDHLCDRDFLYSTIILNHNIDGTHTYAQQLGKSVTNVDGFIECFNLYFDVKCFKDNVKEILGGIIEQFKKKNGLESLHIAPEFESYVSYDDFQKNRLNLLTELEDRITLGTRITYLNSAVIPGLSYRILWEKGISITESTYNPFKHAENFHKTVFNYANKFVKNQRTIIVFVVFPWNNLIISNFSNYNIQFYRAFARRVFCQYRYDTSRFSSFNLSFTGTETIFDVSKDLSGIIFLEDTTILGKKPSDRNVKSYVYLNPNANNKISRSLAHDYLIFLGNSDYDDFENDNY